MRYVVHCIEHGERFFFREEYDEANGSIMEQARETASIWGAEVISIRVENEDAKLVQQ